MTPVEGTWKQIELYRGMTPQQRLQVVFRLHALTRALAAQGVKHQEQLSNQEAAALLGLSEAAASMRYLRAVRRLRAELLPGGQ